MALGYFLLMIRDAFFVALLFVIIGNGFFKPNVSTQVCETLERGEWENNIFTHFQLDWRAVSFR